MRRFSDHARLSAPRAPGDPLVDAELRRRLRARRKLTFAEYLEVALYLLDGGYYEAHAHLGRRGDFLTSPETHPAFGALLARLAHSCWRALGSPKSFSIIEYGAGTGSLCRQILTATFPLDPTFDQALRYVILERSGHLRALQQALLLDLTDRVAWVHPEQRAEFPAGCIIANEVVDALPWHRVQKEGGKLRERYVTLLEGEYREVSDAPSTPELACYFARVGLHPPEGAVVEVCLQAQAWLADAASRLSSGYLVTIDFGGPASEIVGKATPRGGLKCFYQHGWTEDPFDRPGLQDITAPVDFTNLLRLGESLGLETALQTTQRELLSFLGFRSAYQHVAAMDLPVLERQRNLRALELLADPQGLGGFQVLLQRKQAPRFALAAEDVEALPWTPLLPAETITWPQL